MSKQPTLENDKFEDKAIAAMSVGLESYQGEMTNAVYILVRPIDLLSDESGQHPGESFVQLFLTRQELEAILLSLNQDWEDTVKYTAGATERTPA